MSLLWHRGGWTFVARTPSEAAGAVRHGLPIVADRMQQGELACCRQLAGGHPRGHDREPSRPPTPMDAPLRDQLSITGPHRAGAPAPSPECRWTDFGEQTRTGFRERYSVEEWYPLFRDELLASAAMDRLLHHAHVLEMTGRSYRTRGTDKLGGDEAA